MKPPVREIMRQLRSQRDTLVIDECVYYDTCGCETRWKARGGKYYTGLVEYHIWDRTGQRYMGTAICSEKDNFNRKIARAIAKGRAEKCLAEQIPDTDYEQLMRELHEAENPQGGAICQRKILSCQ